MLFSVIIPVFKKEKYLEHCVKTLEMQTYNNFEVILVDDGSPDNCPAICDRLAHYYNNIMVIHQENSGVATARNNGVKIAKGDFVCFLDADDEWHPDYLLHLNEILEETQQMMAFSARYNEFPDGKKVEIKNRREKKYYIISDLIDNFLYTRTSGFSINRNFLREIGGFKPGIKRGEDVELMMRAFCIIKSAVIDNRINFTYRVAAENNTDNTDVLREINPTIYYTYNYPIKLSLYKYVGWASTKYVIKAIKQRRIKLAIKTFFRVKWLYYGFSRISRIIKFVKQ